MSLTSIIKNGHTICLDAWLQPFGKCCFSLVEFKIATMAMEGAGQPRAPVEAAAEDDVQVLNWKSTRPGRAISWTREDVDPCVLTQPTIFLDYINTCFQMDKLWNKIKFGFHLYESFMSYQKICQERVARDWKNNLPMDVLNVLSSASWKGGPLIVLHDAVGRPPAVMLGRNHCWLLPFVKASPSKAMELVNMSHARVLET